MEIARDTTVLFFMNGLKMGKEVIFNKEQAQRFLSYIQDYERDLEITLTFSGEKTIFRIIMLPF